MVKIANCSSSINDRLSVECNNHKSGQLRSKKIIFGQVYLLIETNFYEAQVGMRNECMWLRWIILVFGAGLSFIQEKNHNVICQLKLEIRWISNKYKKIRLPQ
jgi:hypothetical protein